MRLKISPSGTNKLKIISPSWVYAGSLLHPLDFFSVLLRFFIMRCWRKNFLLPFPGSHSDLPNTDFERPQALSCTILESAKNSYAHLVPEKRCFFDVFILLLSLLAYQLYSQILSPTSHKSASTKASYSYGGCSNQEIIDIILKSSQGHFFGE